MKSASGTTNEQEQRPGDQKTLHPVAETKAPAEQRQAGDQRPE